MKFDLAQYETVEERIKRFYAKYDDGRIETVWETSYQAEAETPNIWVVKAYVYLTAGDQANKLPKATGYAFEIDGGNGPNKTAALENAETSSIGRALANMGMSGNKRASREEMQKVERTEEPQKLNPTGRNWATEASKLENIDDLRSLWMEAKAAKAPQKTLDLIQELADAKRDPNGEREGATGSSNAVNEAG